MLLFLALGRLECPLIRIEVFLRAVSESSDKVGRLLT